MREAEVSVTDDHLAAMGVEDLIAIIRDANLRSVDELTCRGTGAVLQVEVERPLEAGTLDAIDAIDEWHHVVNAEDSQVYIISFTAPELPPSLEERATELVGTCDPELEDDGATMSLVGPHEAIVEQLRDYEDIGAAPRLERLGGYDGPSRPLDALTDRQREVIEIAWTKGYYEVPKEATAEDIAAELNVDASTVNEHLQRAERNLLGQFL